jgi:predicted ATPase
MKIQSFAYKNTFQGWGFDKIDFFDLTLLVGVSGVGKTQILQALRDLKQIANGKAINGVEWDIVLTTKDPNRYRWQGQFEKITEKDTISESLRDLLGQEQVLKPKLFNESIHLNDDKKPILVRKNKQIIFYGQAMPKLSLEESCVHLFREEEIINPLYDAFMKIIFRDHARMDKSTRAQKPVSQQIYKNLNMIRDSSLDTMSKLGVVYELFPAVFKQILSNFTDIFPQIEDIKLEIFEVFKPKHVLSEAWVATFFFKEKNVEQWIPEHRMSLGMLRTFLHIAEIFLCGDGTIILIDDFENSLGVNCINVLTEDLVFENKRIQFIVTSHHPYIINKIPYEFWKIVTRRGGQIVTYDAKTFDLGDSRQERFMNLINLPQYRQGLADAEIKNLIS